MPAFQGQLKLRDRLAKVTSGKRWQRVRIYAPGRTAKDTPISAYQTTPPVASAADFAPAHGATVSEFELLLKDLGFAPFTPQDRSRATAARPARRHGAMRPMDPARGLHRLKEDVQLRYSAQQAAQLLAQIEDHIETTHAAAPVRRTEPYCLTRSPRPGLEKATKITEDEWEEALWRHYKCGEGKDLPGAWRCLLTYQVETKNTLADSGWGEIDLLGVSKAFRPVAVELKQHGAKDAILAALVQAWAYGIALRKAWPVLGSQFEQALQKVCKNAPATDRAKADVIPLVVAAPDEYWTRILGPPGTAGSTSHDARQAIDDLAEALAERGLPVCYVRIHHAGTDDTTGLPTITGGTAFDHLAAPSKL